MIKVCHMTSVHDSNDVRVFWKECISLVNAGYSVDYVGFGESKQMNGVNIVGLGDMPKGRIQRMTQLTKKVYDKARELDCDIYHFHDPELLPYGLKLKKQGKIVIFDSHEDVPAQIMDKGYIPKVFRKGISMLYQKYEAFVVKRLDAIVAATPHIAECFKNKAKRIAVVNNYPKLDDIQFQDTPFTEKAPIACYAGGINKIRGEHVMMEAIGKVEGKLLLAGNRPDTIGENVEYLGYLDRNGVNDLYKKSVVGMVLYQPAANHYDAQPIKMFEFMAAGLPVIASDFPLWRRIVEEANCGICVNPLDVDAVSEALEKLFSNRLQAQEMGLRGRKAIETKYCWSQEEKVLLNIYNELVCSK